MNSLTNLNKEYKNIERNIYEMKIEILHSFAWKNPWTILKNCFRIIRWFLSANKLMMAFNMGRPSVTFMMVNLNIQNEVVVKLVTTETVQCPKNPAQLTIKTAVTYPNGVCQLNGNLKWYERNLIQSQQKRVWIVLKSVQYWSRQTKWLLAQSQNRVVVNARNYWRYDDTW